MALINKANPFFLFFYVSWIETRIKKVMSDMIVMSRLSERGCMLESNQLEQNVPNHWQQIE